MVQRIKIINKMVRKLNQNSTSNLFAHDGGTKTLKSIIYLITNAEFNK